MDVQDLLDAAASALAGVGLRTFAGWPDEVKPPQGWAIWKGKTEDQNLDGSSFVGLLEVYVAVDLGNLRAAQKNLAPYASPGDSKSIEDALFAAPTLGGTVSDVLYVGTEGPAELEVNKVTMLGYKFSVRVLVG